LVSAQTRRAGAAGLRGRQAHRGRFRKCSEPLELIVLELIFMAGAALFRMGRVNAARDDVSVLKTKIPALGIFHKQLLANRIDERESVEIFLHHGKKNARANQRVLQIASPRWAIKVRAWL
jgi:hypothetical protein